MNTPKVIAYMLGNILKEQKKELNKTVHQDSKLIWIKDVAAEILNLVEKRLNEFNAKNPYSKLTNLEGVSAIQSALDHLLKYLALEKKSN